MKLLAVIFFVCFYYNSVAQNSNSDTIYFSGYMDTCKKEDAQFFKVCQIEYNTLRVTVYTRDWQLESSGFYKISEPDVKDGYFKLYSRKGNLESEGNYISGKRSGLWKSYRIDGSLHYEEDYLDGKLNGKLKSYYKEKYLKREENYKEGEFVSGKCFTISGKDTGYYPFREMPEFNGGEDALYKFIAQEVRYPKMATRQGIQGIVKIAFIIDKIGNITDVRIYKNIHPSLNYEAIRVIEKMPKWKPGRIEGENVETKFIIPIKFVLQ